jgi:predicted unusual protein kinase regulating ubiquinone biosynthesis (AarF/ABC1/UbiB family)
MAVCQPTRQACTEFIDRKVAKIDVCSHFDLRQRWLDALVSSLEMAGCSFQKFGQWLSMRPDMIPQDAVKALSSLRQV